MLKQLRKAFGRKSQRGQSQLILVLAIVGVVLIVLLVAHVI